MLTYKQLSLFTTFLILLSLALIGCGGANNAVADSVHAASGTFKVALLLPGEPDDKSWSQVGYEGLKLVEKELGAKVAYTANVSEADAEKVTHQYANEGYNFIIGHGGEYVQAFEIVGLATPLLFQDSKSVINLLYFQKPATQLPAGKAYKNQVRFTTYVRLKSEQAQLRGYVNYMTCDSEKCLPPQDVPFEFVFSH